LATRLRSSERQEMVTRNEQNLAEIKATADRLTLAVEQFRRLSLRDQNGELNELREELDESLKVAHRAEERMRDIENNIGYDRHLRE
jgi:methyl-accepting chemotaxis protein